MLNFTKPRVCLCLPHVQFSALNFNLSMLLLHSLIHLLIYSIWILNIAHNFLFPPQQSSTSNSLPHCNFPVGNFEHLKSVNKLCSSLSSCQSGFLVALAVSGHSSFSEF